MIIYFLCAVNILLLVTGQTLWKFGIIRAGGLIFPAIILSPFVWAGLVLYVIATAIWFIVLSKMELSVAYPLQSLAYVLGVCVAWMIFNEAVPVTRWLGVGVIILGVYLVSLK